MKVSVMLCFCQFLPFFVLFVTETFAMINHNIGLTFGKEFQNKFRSYKLPNPRETLCPMEKRERFIKNTDGYRPKYSQKTFKQRLNHYDSMERQTFLQRYFVHKGNYQVGNPVFLLVGGLDEIELYNLENGIWNHFAKEAGALLVALEHRMYRKSYPFKTFSTEILSREFLNSEQALADLAYFIENADFDEDYTYEIQILPHTKWIALGSGYGGTLAARLRAKFPHKVKAAVTVNALLLPTVAFEGYYTVLENQCITEKVDKTIKEALKQFDDGYKPCDENDLDCIECLKLKYELFTKTLNICHNDLSYNYNGKDHKYFALWSLATIIGLALQFGNESGQTVKTDVIKILLDEKQIPKALDRLGEAVKLVLKSHNIPCLIVDYLNLIDLYKNESHDAETYLNYIFYRGLGNRQTLYLRCTEWGQFETAYKEDGLFAKLIPMEFYKDLCKHVFGPEINEKNLEKAVKKTDMFHGGREINVSNVLFIMHDDDLWTQLGYSNSKPKNEITDNCIAVLLKKEDGEKSVSRELIDKWNLILKLLKHFSSDGVVLLKLNGKWISVD